MPPSLGHLEAIQNNNRKETTGRYSLQHIKKALYFSIVMQAIVFVSINQSPHYLIDVLQNNVYSDELKIQEKQYQTFASFIGIPNFYTKHGHHSVDPNDNLLTICSMCSLDILPQSDPLSLAVYIDSDITHHTQL
eukprot:267836_1